MALVAAFALITARLFVWPVTGSLPLGNWPYQIACEWGASFKALVLYRSC